MAPTKSKKHSFERKKTPSIYKKKVRSEKESRRFLTVLLVLVILLAIFLLIR